MDGVEIVAQLMAISATTAPKSKGENFVQTKLLQGEVLKELADAMFAFGFRLPAKASISIDNILDSPQVDCLV